MSGGCDATLCSPGYHGALRPNRCALPPVLLSSCPPVLLSPFPCRHTRPQAITSATVWRANSMRPRSCPGSSGSRIGKPRLGRGTGWVICPPSTRHPRRGGFQCRTARAHASLSRPSPPVCLPACLFSCLSCPIIPMSFQCLSCAFNRCVTRPPGGARIPFPLQHSVLEEGTPEVVKGAESGYKSGMLQETSKPAPKNKQVRWRRRDI